MAEVQDISEVRKKYKKKRGVSPLFFVYSSVLGT